MMAESTQNWLGTNISDFFKIIILGGIFEFEREVF